MKFGTAIGLFDDLKSETDNRSEIKVYENFIGIISELDNKGLDTDELEDIEYNLDTLGLHSIQDNRKKFYKKNLGEFKKYLKDEFSLISEGYYTGLGMALGLAFGVAFGSAIGASNGLIFVMLIGLVIGASMDSEAKKQNRVLKTTLS
ncbi:MAG: hypothetical protein ACJATI_005149 [Halioglobus sp.]|jgi:hypothetical protein